MENSGLYFQSCLIPLSVLVMRIIFTFLKVYLHVIFDMLNTERSACVPLVLLLRIGKVWLGDQSPLLRVPYADPCGIVTLSQTTMNAANIFISRQRRLNMAL